MTTRQHAIAIRDINNSNTDVIRLATHHLTYKERKSILYTLHSANQRLTQQFTKHRITQLTTTNNLAQEDINELDYLLHELNTYTKNITQLIEENTIVYQYENYTHDTAHEALTQLRYNHRISKSSNRNNKS